MLIFTSQGSFSPATYLAYLKSLKVRRDHTMSGEWSDMYGEVVWAKCPPYEWWPCYVYDPDKIPDSSQEVRKKAAKVKGKQYAVYFYGDTSYSFTAPKNVVLYSEESTAKYADTKHPKKFIEQFEAGKKIAEAEFLLEKKGRVNFHLQGTGAEPLAAKKESGRQKKDKPAAGSDELYFSEAQKQDQRGLGGSETGPKFDCSTENIGAPKMSRKRKQTAGSQDDTAASGKKARGRPRTKPLGQQGRERGDVGEESGEEGDDGEKDEDESDESGSFGTEVSEEEDGEEDEVVIKRPKKVLLPSGQRSSLPRGNSAGQSSSSAGAAAGASGASTTTAFSEESLVDRLVRFGRILSHCCANGAAQQNLARIVKVFDKLDLVELTMSDLQKSGIGKTVSELRKVADPVVSARAQALRAKWKAIVQSGGGELPNSNAVRPRQEPSVVAELPQPACTKETSGAQLQAPDGHIAPAAVLSAGQNQARGRAVRLLREAAAAAAAAVPSNTGSTSTSMSSGELAFAVEKAAMEAFGAGQPRYFEFVTRYAVRLKSGSGVQLSDDTHVSVVLNSFDFVSAHTAPLVHH